MGFEYKKSSVHQNRYLQVFNLNQLIQQQTAMSSKKNLANINKFIVKLVGMMKQFPSIINWSDNGQQLQIYNVQLFITQVHPKYFTTSNYKSFLRQLNMYNFSKMSKRKNSVNFKHSTFCKGQQHLLQTIKRRKNSNKHLEDFIPTTFSESMELFSKQSCTGHQYTSTTMDIQVKQLLKQVKWALKGQASQAFLKLQSYFEKLICVYNSNCNNLEKSHEVPQLKEYFSMPKIDDMLEMKREAFSESEYAYNQESYNFKQS